MKEFLAVVLAAAQLAGGAAYITQLNAQDETETPIIFDGDGNENGGENGGEGNEGEGGQGGSQEEGSGEGGSSSEEGQQGGTGESGSSEEGGSEQTTDPSANEGTGEQSGEENTQTEADPGAGTEADPGDTMSNPADENAVDDTAVQPAPGSQVDAFVTRLYSVTLNRTPDDAGLRSWADLLINKKATGASVARGFIFSSEFQGLDLSNEEYVECMYLAFMGRPSDPAGKAGWVSVLESMGRLEGRENVFEGFANSSEFLGICDSYGIVRGYYMSGRDCDETGAVNLFVERLYTVILGRSSDPAGLKGWTEALLSHQNTGIEAAAGFVFSREYLNMNKTDSEYIDDLYMAFMGRAADPAGKQAWLSRLAAGDSRRMVFNGFAGSDEFTAICESYGILRGSELPIATVTTGGQVTWEAAMADKGLYVPYDWIDEFVYQSEYWLRSYPSVTYRMGGKSLESGAIDCSGFVTQLMRRALDTMAPTGSYASDPNARANFEGYQDMTPRGTWNDNRGGARPTAEGVYSISSTRSYQCYVDRFGILSPNLMDVVHWYDYLMSNNVRYTCVNVREVSEYNEWDFLRDHKEGDIVIWSGRNGNFSSADDVHIAVYDGNGGVYQSSSNTGGLSHVAIWDVLMNPSAAGAKKIYIFRMS